MSREEQVVHTFVELADTLVDEFDALDFMLTLTERAVTLLGADEAGLIIADQRGDLQVVASTSQQTRVLEIFQVQNGEGGPCIECFRTNQPLVNLEVDTVADRWPRFRQACLDAGFRSSHALPMRLRNQTIGALNLYCVNTTPLSDADVALGQAMADIATIGLMQERIISQQEVLSEQLQGALNSRVVIEQAKGVLAERNHIDLDDAFNLIRGHARQARESLRQVAADVIDGTLEIGERAH